MIIKKILEQKDIQILRQGNKVEVTKSNKKLQENDLIAEIVELFKNKNLSLDSEYNKFFNNEITLMKIIEKHTVKSKKQFLKSIMEYKAYENCENTEIKEQITFFYKSIRNTLRKEYGEKFCIMVGHLFYNANKTLCEINRDEKSHIKKIYKSLISNKIEDKKNKFHKIEIDKEKVKTNICFIMKNYIKYSKEEINNLEKEDKIALFNKIAKISILLKEKENNDINLNIEPKEAIKELKKEYKNLKFNKETRNLQKIYYAIKRDINFFVNNNLKKEEYNYSNWQSDLIKIILDKIKIFKENELKKQNFVNHNNHILKDNVILNDYNLILSHSVYKFYRNLATIAGCMIVNYDLNKNNKKEFYDFSKNEDDFKKFLNDKSNYENLTIENFQNIEIKKKVFNSIQLFRNNIMHIRNLNDNIELKDKNSIISKLENIANENIKEKFKVHKIDTEEIFLWTSKKISLSFSRIYNRIKLENSKSNKLKNKTWSKFIEQENTNIEEFNSKKFYINWIYDNDFQNYLKTLGNEDWKLYIEKFNELEKEKFNNWEEAKLIEQLRIIISNFPEMCSNDISIFLNTELGKSKKEEYEKNSKIVENLWKFIFIEYCKKINKLVNLYMNSDNTILNSTKNKEYKIKTDEKIEYHWIVNSLLILNISELANTKKYLENFYNRTFKNSKISSEFSNVKEEYKFLLNKDSINNLIKIVNLVINSKKDIITEEEKNNFLNSNKNLNEIWKKMYPEDKIVDNFNYLLNSSHTNFFKILKFEYFDLIKNSLKNYIDNNDVKVLSNKYEKNTKQFDLMQANIERYNNKQSIINAIELKKYINYFLINWVMHREFDVYNLINEEEKIFLGNWNKKIKDYKIENGEINVSKKKEKKVIKKIEEIIEEIIEEKENIELFYEKFKNLKKYNNNFNKIYEFSKLVKHILNTSEEVKSNKNYKMFIIEIKKIQNSIPDKISELYKINYHTEILSHILHLNHTYNNSYDNLKLKYSNLQNTINTLRDDLNYKRHKKNQIIPSLIRMFEKQGINILFTFENHKIAKIELKSKNVELTEYNIDSKFNHELLLPEEIKIYEELLLN